MSKKNAASTKVTAAEQSYSLSGVTQHLETEKKNKT